jgi:uncharacterized protein YfbU (UPF0304 family)
MTLTDPEKLILMMLSEIHEHLKIKSGTDAKFVQSAILSGNTWGLYWRFIGIFEGRGDTPAAVKQVLDILEMWEAIEISYEKLDAGKKELIAARNLADDVRFRGFDGNHEAEQLGIAHFLIDDLARFTHFKGRDLNSHLPYSLAPNERMLSVFKRHPVSPERFKMNAAQIIEMLQAQRLSPAPPELTASSSV